MGSVLLVPPDAVPDVVRRHSAALPGGIDRAVARARCDELGMAFEAVAVDPGLVGDEVVAERPEVAERIQIALQTVVEDDLCVLAVDVDAVGAHDQVRVPRRQGDCLHAAVVDVVALGGHIHAGHHHGHDANVGPGRVGQQQVEVGVRDVDPEPLPAVLDEEVQIVLLPLGAPVEDVRIALTGRGTPEAAGAAVAARGVAHDVDELEAAGILAHPVGAEGDGLEGVADSLDRIGDLGRARAVQAELIRLRLESNSEGEGGEGEGGSRGLGEEIAHDLSLRREPLEQFSVVVYNAGDTFPARVLGSIVARHLFKQKSSERQWMSSLNRGNPLSLIEG